MNAHLTYPAERDFSERLLDRRTAVRPDGHLLVMISILALVKLVTIVTWLM